jgi:hypothetical protein
MIGATASDRLRPVCAVAVVAAVLFSLLALCCCAGVDLHAPSAAGEPAGLTSIHIAQDRTADDPGHVDPDCAQPSTSDVAVATPGTATDDISTALTPAEATSAAGPAPADRLRSPVPHLLCVMRT